MSRHFLRTLRSLEGERRFSASGFVVVGLLFAAWLTWLFAARISVFEVTRLGRLEMDRAADVIESEVAGRVVSVDMVVDLEVKPGDVLVQLETADLETRLGELLARRDSLVEQRAALEAELELQDDVLEEGSRGRLLAIEEERKLLETTEKMYELASAKADRAVRLHDEGQLASADRDAQVSEAEQLRATVEAQRVALDRAQSERRGIELETRRDRAELESSLARLDGSIAETGAGIERLRVDIEKRSIRAPRAGRVGEVKPLTPSVLVREGERLGTILAAGEIRLVGDFSPTSALGRIRVGQRAQARLDSFPWTRYGMLAATVTRVAGEPRDGQLRVELEVDRSQPRRIPLQHGLTGTVEVEVERISPAALLLRSLGKGLEAGADAVAPAGGRRP